MNIAVAGIDRADEKEGMTPETCRAGRALIGLSQTELAERVGVTPLAIRNYEAGKSDPPLSRWHAIRRVLEQGGVLFLDEDDAAGPGVRLRKR
jgi:transcriptional regulator with XRE-family HTH domain